MDCLSFSLCFRFFVGTMAGVGCPSSRKLTDSAASSPPMSGTKSSSRSSAMEEKREHVSGLKRRWISGRWYNVPSNALVCPPQPCATHPLSSTFPTFPTTLNGTLCLLFVLTSLMLPFSSSTSRPPASRAQTSTIRMKSSYAPSSSSHSTHDHRLTAFLSRQEFPICLMKWQDRDRHMKASNLQVVDEFRSFVRPSWRPILSSFCTELTGITQVCLVSRSTASLKNFMEN